MSELTPPPFRPARISSDQTKAAAIFVAKQWLDKQDWKYSPKLIGEKAREIIEALEAES